MAPPTNDLRLATLSAPLLVVDDDPVSRAFITDALGDNGFTNIRTETNGQAALDAISAQRPELVVMDINMPGIDGLTCCQRIRQQPETRDLPVLMLTALDDTKLRYRSFEAGATDFVSKPLHPAELNARVKVHLQNRLSLKSLQEYQSRLNAELDNARDLQVGVLPTISDIQEVYRAHQLDIAAHISTSSEIGGDFWGFKVLIPGQIAIWAVDFSGHGVASALNAFRLQAFLKEHSPLATRPGEYLSFMNEKLLNPLSRGYFATMFYGVIDLPGNTLHYACACTPHPIIHRLSGSALKLDGSGVPLGVCLQTYSTHKAPFNAGDTLFLHSDALTETTNASGVFLSDDDLVAMLAESPGQPASVMMNNLHDSFMRFTSTPVADDLTLCFIQRTTRL